jgi:hypothetical protein
MKSTHPSPWERLASAARRAPQESDAAAPYGFATRVVAQAFAMPPSNAQALLERLALRGFIAAGAMGLAAAAYGVTAFTALQEGDLLIGDMVLEVLAES